VEDEKLNTAEEYDKAIAELTEALKMSPDNADLYKKRAEAHADIALHTDFDSEGADEIKKTEKMLAIEDYSAAIKLNPEDAQSYQKRGMIYKLLENDQKALADCNQAIAIDSDMDSAYWFRGLLYSGQNKFKAAIDDFDKAINLNKGEACYYWTRGEAYEKRGDLDNAFADFREAARLGNDFDLCNYDLGDKYKERGEYQQAIEAYSESIKKEPDWVTFAYSERADAYEAQGNYKAALADLTTLIQILSGGKEKEYSDSYIAYAYTTRGELYYETGIYDYAIKDYTDAIDRYNKSTEIDNKELAEMHYDRAFAYESFGDYAKAKADFETAVRLDPDNAEYRKALEKAR
jgi:tetratricopeptide (TPR) repeat protein